MAKRDPALQLLIDQHRLKEAELAFKKRVHDENMAAKNRWLALQETIAANNAASIALRGTPRKSRARLQEEIDSAAKLAYDKAYHEEHGLPWPPQTTREPKVIHLKDPNTTTPVPAPTPAPLNPDPQDLGLDALEQAQARRTAQIAADLAAYHERQTQEHLAALTPAERVRLAKRQQEMDDAE